MHSRSDHLRGVYMVEFSTSMKDHGREIILEHILSTAHHGFDKLRISFRTKTRTNLFHGHSFHVHGDYDEAHLLNIPGAIKVYPVGYIKITFIL